MGDIVLGHLGDAVAVGIVCWQIVRCPFHWLPLRFDMLLDDPVYMPLRHLEKLSYGAEWQYRPGQVVDIRIIFAESEIEGFTK